MREPPTAVDVARAVADTLQQHGIDYAIGGALALAFYAPPRATIDVDVNAFVDVSTGMDAVRDALTAVGFTFDGPWDRVRSAAAETGQFRGTIHGLRVDVFIPAIPYYGELFSGSREVTLLGRPIRVLGPEDLAVLKVMFFRRKDLADVEALYRDQGPNLDRGYIRARLIEFVGEDDERLRALEAIERDVDA